MNTPTRAAALVALLALFAAALLALSTTHASPPPEDIQLILRADDADGIIAPGQEIKLSAAVRFSGQYGEVERLKFSNFSLDSILGWETASGRSLPLSETYQADGNPTWEQFGIVMGSELVKPYDAAGVQLPANSIAVTVAMDGRTAVARASQNNLHIYDTWNKRQALIIPTPTGGATSFGASERRFPTSGAQLHTDRYYHGRAIAVWHETETLAWLFIGEPAYAGPASANPNLGRLHIYTLDWSTDPPTATATGTTLEPTLNEAGNHYVGAGGYTNDSTHYWASYGSAVAVSADGSTLAVSAPRIHHTGAVYVYSRPDGPGRDWSDITYDDGVKVATAPIPHWGTSEATSTVPFTGSTCDQICIRQRAGLWSWPGWRTVGLSADGRVLTFGAPGKHHDDFGNTIPAFTGTGGRPNSGVAYVFVAPDGGWQAAPDVVAGKTLLTPKMAAPNDYTRNTHTTHGPKRRITTPTATLRARAWASTQNTWHFGQFVTITRDGTAVAVGTNSNAAQDSNSGPGRAFIFQVDSVDGWAAAAKPWVADVDISGLAGYGSPGWCGMAFNGLGTTLTIGACGEGVVHGQDNGTIFHLRRPADGRWVGGAVGTLGTRAVEPIGPRVGNGYGFPLYSLNGERLAISAIGIKIIDHSCCTANSSFPGHTYFSDANCYERRDTGGNITTTCPLILGDSARIVVPTGQPEGPLAISARITLFMSYGTGAGAIGDDSQNARTISSQPLALRIGTVAELAEAKLDLANDDRGTSTGDDDRPFPDSLSNGERTVLRIQLLNENGLPADADAIASIIATTSRGSLSSNIRDSGNAGITNGCLGGGGSSCQIEPSLLTGDVEQARLFVVNEAATPVGFSADNILLTLTHTGTAGPADVSVRAIAKDGQNLTTETIRVNLLGPPTALSIAAPSSGLLNVGTPDTGLDADNRDILTLAVTAADEYGVKAPLPTSGSLRATLTDPDGKRVTSGVALEWPLLNVAGKPALNAAGDRQVRINVNRPAAQPLANGEYTLSLRLGTLSAEQTLRVSGGVAAVALNPNSLDAPLDADFTVTATLTDAQGDPVPDGTAVEWTEIAAASGAAGIVQRSADRTTTAGQASATYLAVSPGRITLTAASNGITAVTLVTVPAPPEPSIAEMLTTTSPNAFATWLGAQTIQAADLLPTLEGVAAIATWRNGRWLRYGVEKGQLLPGSTDFPIPRAAILWLSN